MRITSGSFRQGTKIAYQVRACLNNDIGRICRPSPHASLLHIIPCSDANFLMSIEQHDGSSPAGPVVCRRDYPFHCNALVDVRKSREWFPGACPIDKDISLLRMAVSTKTRDGFEHKHRNRDTSIWPHCNRRSYRTERTEKGPLRAICRKREIFWVTYTQSPCNRSQQCGVPTSETRSHREGQEVLLVKEPVT